MNNLPPARFRLMVALETNRLTLGLPLYLYADNLSLKRRFYQMLRAGERRPGADTLAHIITAYHYLEPDVIAYLHAPDADR